MTAAITVAQPTPTSRATAATECPSRPTRRHACLRARSLHDARALICGWVSVQVCCSHSGWVQRQMRLTQTNVTGRSPVGRSRTHVGRRPCNLAAAPHTGHQPVDAVVWIAYSISPSRSDTASTAMPSSPSITVALLLFITWGLSFVSVTPRIMRPQARFQTQPANRVDPPLPRFIEKSHITKDSMRAAFAGYARAYGPASMRRCWSTSPATIKSRSSRRVMCRQSAIAHNLFWARLAPLEQPQVVLRRHINGFRISVSTHLVNNDRGMAALVRIDPDEHHGTWGSPTRFRTAP